ncbi:hypothetical protein ES702_00541 [subsurface metagenome]
MNWKRLLCIVGWHKPVLVTELPEKAIVSGGPPLSIPIDHPGGEAQFKGKVVCLWCGKGLKATIELRQDYIQGEKVNDCL